MPACNPVGCSGYQARHRSTGSSPISSWSERCDVLGNLQCGKGEHPAIYWLFIHPDWLSLPAYFLFFLKGIVKIQKVFF